MFKKNVLLILSALTLQVQANEVKFVGAFTGDLPFKLPYQEVLSVPYNNATWAGRAYIGDKYKNNIDRWVQEVLDKKAYTSKDRDEIINICKKYGFKYAAKTNIRSQIEIDDVRVNVFWSYTALCWSQV